MLCVRDSKTLCNFLLPTHILRQYLQHCDYFDGCCCLRLDIWFLFRDSLSLWDQILGFVVRYLQCNSKSMCTVLLLTRFTRAPLKFLLANCYASTPMFQAFTISDVITDVMILIIPIYWTSKLQMSFRRKLAICAIFLLGGVYAR